MLREGLGLELRPGGCGEEVMIFAGSVSTKTSSINTEGGTLLVRTAFGSITAMPRMVGNQSFPSDARKPEGVKPLEPARVTRPSPLPSTRVDRLRMRPSAQSFK